MGSAPKPPNAKKTAATQMELNKQTAQLTQQTNMVNQRGPQGSLTYNQVGTYPDGSPRYEAVQELSAGEQGVYNNNVATRGANAQTASNLATNAQGMLSSPFQAGNESTEARLAELGRARLDPRFAEQRDALETNLINRGIMPGSEAYDRETRRFSESQNDAYNQLFLTGRQQAVNEGMSERNQAINEIGALLNTGTQQPQQMTNTPQTQVSGVDYAGLKNAQYQAQSANYQGMLGGISGLFGQAAGIAGGWAGGGFR